jgi:predicted lipoprotein with Yx(FWY)xxD motif
MQKHDSERSALTNPKGHAMSFTLTRSAAGLALLAVLATGCSAAAAGYHATAGPAASSSSSGSTVKTATINGATVLTNAQGLTLYWFAPDTMTTSHCNGTCAQLWPPVHGPVTAGPGVTGKLATIARADGAIQASYHGHPLYTYVADTAPGQAKGNGLNVYGGIWHEVTASGAAAPASVSGGGSYGY